MERSFNVHDTAHAFLIESGDQIGFHVPDMQILVNETVQYPCDMVIFQLEELGFHCFQGWAVFLILTVSLGKQTTSQIVS